MNPLMVRLNDMVGQSRRSHRGSKPGNRPLRRHWLDDNWTGLSFTGLRHRTRPTTPKGFLEDLIRTSDIDVLRARRDSNSQPSDP